MNAKVRMVVAALLVTSGLLTLTWAASSEVATRSESELKLPKPETSGGMTLNEALAARRSQRAFTDKPIAKEQLGQLCWAAQGITQPARGLRTAPSALALYPIHLFIVDATGLYEYDPKGHALRGTGEPDAQAKLREIMKQPSVGSAPVCAIITMDLEHMKPRCGDRAERFSLLEAGAVAQNLLLEATALGLSSVPMGGVDEGKLTTALKIPSPLRPVYVLPIGYAKPR